MVQQTSRFAECRVCGNRSRYLHHAPLLRHQVAYHECDRCSYVQTEDPYWLEEAYRDAINDSDTGIIRRNQRNSQLVIQLLATLGCLRGRVVDCAGGYGLLVRMLRDAGVNALWQDPYCQNLMARGFEAQDGWQADLVTGFEVLEHLVNPIEFFEGIVSRARYILVSTQLIPNPTPHPDQWWYYGRDHGQHIGFFRTTTLQYLADHFGWQLVSDGRGLHLFCKEPLARWRFSLARKTRVCAPWTARLVLDSLMWPDHKERTRARCAA